MAAHLNAQAGGGELVVVALVQAVLSHERGQVLEAVSVSLRCRDVQ